MKNKNLKILFHTADYHIRNYQFHDQYRKIFNDMISEFKEKSKGYEYDEIRIIIAGDFFHQKITTSNEQVLFGAWLLNKLAKIGKVIIIPGNHDFLENNHGRLDSITPVVDLINNPNVIYYRESGVYKDENINWVIYSLYDDNKSPEFTKEKDQKYFGLFHGPITGSKTNTGFIFDNAYDKSIFSGLDIVFCGDIHSRFVMEEGNTKIYMVGSAIMQSFGENVNHHGYGIYVVDKDEYTFCDLHNDSPFLKFKITDIEDLEYGKEILVNVER